MNTEQIELAPELKDEDLEQVSAGKDRTIVLDFENRRPRDPVFRG